MCIVQEGGDKKVISHNGLCTANQRSVQISKKFMFCAQGWRYSKGAMDSILGFCILYKGQVYKNVPENVYYTNIKSEVNSKSWTARSIQKPR